MSLRIFGEIGFKLAKLGSELYSEALRKGLESRVSAGLDMMVKVLKDMVVKVLKDMVVKVLKDVMVKVLKIWW